MEYSFNSIELTSSPTYEVFHTSFFPTDFIIMKDTTRQE